MSERSILVFVSNYRNYENIENLLMSLSHHNWIIRFIFTKNQADVSTHLMSEIPFEVLSEYSVDPHNFQQKLRKQILDENRNEIKKSQLVLLPDVQNYPNSTLFWKIKRINKDIRIIGFQHGLYQVWTKNFLNPICDFYFAFGEESKSFFPKHRQSDLVLSGLPKLELKRARQDAGKYILFLAQNVLDPERVETFLRQVSVSFKLPILIRDHPQYPNFYTLSDEFLYLSELTSLSEQIEGAKFIITSASTCIIESLMSDKPTVILPGENKSFLRDYEPVMGELTLKSFKENLAIFETWNYKAWLKIMVVNSDKDLIEENRFAVEAIAGFRKDHPLFLKSKKHNFIILKEIFIKSVQKLFRI